MCLDGSEKVGGTRAGGSGNSSNDHDEIREKETKRGEAEELDIYIPWGFSCV
jgi:hypothetical protein